MKRFCSLSKVVLPVVCSALCVFGQSAATKKSNHNLPRVDTRATHETAKPAVGHYLLTNDNNPNGNTVSTYQFTNGSLKLVDMVPTGGNGSGSGSPNNNLETPFDEDEFLYNICTYQADNASTPPNYTFGGIDEGYVSSVASTGNPHPFTKVGEMGPPISGGIQYQAIGPVVINGPWVDVFDNNTYVSMIFYDFQGGTGIFTYKENSDCTLWGPTFAPWHDGDHFGVMSSIPQRGSHDHSPGGIVGFSNNAVGSYRYTKSGKVVKYGPYSSQGKVATVQVTPDGKFAVFGDKTTGSPQIEVYPIHSNNSLGNETVYSNLGPGSDSENLHFSPDQRFLYVGNRGSGQITTLKFDKKTGSVQYACISSTLNGFGSNWAATDGIDTESATGAGGYLYVVEDAGGLSSYSSIGVLAVNETTGCPAEVSGSPFANKNSPGSFSLAAWSPKTPALSVFHTLNGQQDGGQLQGGLVQDLAGNFYGSAELGGAFGYGTVFKLDKTGKETVLYNFTGAGDGSNPYGDLFLATTGDLFGTTGAGGASGYGTVFKLNPQTGQETVLHTFAAGADGAYPTSSVVQDASGTLYGTTLRGGAFGYGIVYKLDSNGVETVLHNFGGPSDGAYPYAGVVLDAAGNLYGATAYGGTGSCASGPGCGTLYKVDTTGTESILYSFTGGADSAYPNGVVLDAAGNIYGSASGGYAGTGYGTVFKLDTTNQLTVLYTFTGGTDGSIPASPLFRDGVGALFGTTEYGGVSGAGTVFEVEPDGQVFTLHSFSGGKDGASPEGKVFEGASGGLYGTTVQGGVSGGCGGPGCGVVFKLLP
jgi:uncharacterized repeat protein (TIGR03803 family)